MFKKYGQIHIQKIGYHHTLALTKKWGVKGMYYGYDNCCYPTYNYAPCGYGYGGGYRNGFALIVVLFILLIIIGASWIGPKC